ncbi:MAG TPA: LamG-like jellyroll fold domain-containing protein [Armatimonadota bacterium]|nr:LamG-like jellyroll fold domain-containing protein [Armatimonadota bacterium]
MSYKRIIPLILVFLAALGSAHAQDKLLLHYTFDEGQGTAATDASGNKLNGTVSAAWTASPSGKALSFDGKSSGIVKIAIPTEQRFGKDSWTFSAWLKPAQFTIDDRQNQRRVFAFGTFPDAYLVIDLTGSGRMNYYFCYRDEAGKTVSSGGESSMGLTLGEWAHVVLVCDRKSGQVETYLNGFSQGSTMLPRNFAGDYVLGGELTLGNGWHNYWGLMDEGGWPKPRTASCP